MMKESEQLIFTDLKADFKNADDAKNRHKSLLDLYVKYYNADDIPDADNRSKVKLRWIKAACDSTINRIVNDLTKDYEITQALPKEYTPSENAVAMTSALNETWNLAENNKRVNCELAASAFVVEGTLIVKDSFEYDFDIIQEEYPIPKIREEKDENGVPTAIENDIEAIKKGLTDNGYEILKEKETDIDVILTVKYKKITKQYPSWRIVDNRNFMYDPNATCLEDAMFYIEKYKMTVSSIRKNDKKINPDHGIFENTEELIMELVKSRKLDESVYTTAGQYTDGDYRKWVDDIANKHARREVDVYYYVGLYDGGRVNTGKPDGKLIKIEAYFTDEVLLMIKPYDLPVITQYHMARCKININEMWGEPTIVVQGHSYQMGGTACIRTLIDTAAGHALDRVYVNTAIVPTTEVGKIQKRLPGAILCNGDVNAAIKNGDAIPMQTPVVQLLQMLSYNFQKEAGAPDNQLGVTGGMQADSATEAQIAQSGFMTNYMALFNAIRDDILRPMFNNWALYLDAYIQPTSTFFVTHMFGTKSTGKFTGEQLKGKYDNDIVLTSRSIVNEQTNRLLALMQTLPQMVQLNAMPPSFPAQLYARLFEQYGDKELAQGLREYTAMVQSQEFAMAVQREAVKMATEMVNSSVVQEGIRKDRDVEARREVERMKREEAEKGEK